MALWGLSFKPNTDDIREIGLTIIKELVAEGVQICALRSEAMPNVKAQVGNQVEFAERQYDALRTRTLS